MAHFLSEVTHQKLDQRREQVVCTYTKGIQCTDEFSAYVRCVEVVPRRTVVGSNEFVVWTGNQDGTISVRRGISGEEVYRIERKRNVFVYCLLQYGNFMWAGLSDGYLRIYDIETFDLVFETKLHSAGIACMIFANGSIFTGGYDWQILQWDPVEIRIVERGQYSGHQNAVRCFACDGSLLFSGGDDYAIRCWDMDESQEKMLPWPIVGHRGGIRALVVMEVYLFSGSTDGTVKVWNTQTAQLVRVLDRREGAVTSLMRDESSFRVWSGNVDGTISIWNASTLEPVSLMTDHSGSFVCRLHAMCRLNAMKAWSVGEDGTVKVWFSETDATDGTDYDHIMKMESEHHRQVEQMRSNIIQNYQELEKRRNQLNKIEIIDADRKSKLAMAFANKLTADVKRAYFAKIMKWRILQRTKSKMRATAETAGASLIRDLRTEYYWKIAKFLQQKKDKRRKLELGSALMRSTESGLVATYLKNLLEFARQERQAERRRMAAHALATSTQRGLLRIFYSNLARFADRQRTKRKRDAITGVILRSTDQALLAAYWKNLETYVKARSEASRRANLAGGLLRSTEQGLLRVYYKKLAVSAKRSIDLRRRADIADTLFRSSDIGLRKLYFSKLQAHNEHKKTQPLYEQLEDLNARTAEMQDLLSSRTFMTEEELEAELQRRADRLAAIEQENADLDKEIRDLEVESRRLRLELRRENYLDPSMSVQGQVEQAMYLLKARGVNCKFNFAAITEARAGVKDPDKLMDGGVNKVAKVYSKVIAPEKLRPRSDEPTWFTSSEAVDKIVRSKKLSDKVLIGVADIVVANDIMDFSGAPKNWVDSNDEFLKEHQKKAELFTNINCFLEVVMNHFHTCMEGGRKPPVAAVKAKATARVGSFLKQSAHSLNASRQASRAAQNRDSVEANLLSSPDDLGAEEVHSEGAHSDDEAQVHASPAPKPKKKAVKPKDSPSRSPAPATSRGPAPAGRGTSSARPSTARASVSPSPGRAGAARTPYFGLQVADASTSGVEVSNVAEGGPAAAAGLQVGDHITHFGGTEVVKGKLAFNKCVKAHAKVDEEVEIAFVRDGESHIVKVLVAAKQ